MVDLNSAEAPESTPDWYLRSDCPIIAARIVKALFPRGGKANNESRQAIVEAELRPVMDTILTRAETMEHERNVALDRDIQREVADGAYWPWWLVGLISFVLGLVMGGMR